MKRLGIGLIELVISIVIIGMVMMSIPMLIMESEENDEYSILQETILANRTKLAQIMTYRWDENAVEPLTGIIRIVDTLGDSDLNRSVSNKRAGNVIKNFRRKMLDTPTFATMAVDGLDDIDDFNGQNSQVVFQEATASQGMGYKNRNFNLLVNVQYISDSANYNNPTISFSFDASATSPTSTNIKMITLDTLFASVDNRTNIPFRFRAFACNIGSIQLEERRYE